MIYSRSCEASGEASDIQRVIGNAIRDAINVRLKHVTLEAIWDEWEWFVVPIIISPTMGEIFSERAYRNSKAKYLDIRLKLDFDEFVNGSHAHRLDMYFALLHRSVRLMAKWKMSEADQNTLHALLDEVRMCDGLDGQTGHAARP